MDEKNVIQAQQSYIAKLQETISVLKELVSAQDDQIKNLKQLNKILKQSINTISEDC